MRCIECNRIVAPRENPWAEVQGWERNREAGGTNHIALRKRTGRNLCPECMVKLQSGLNVNQMSMEKEEA